MRVSSPVLAFSNSVYTAYSAAEATERASPRKGYLGAKLLTAATTSAGLGGEMPPMLPSCTCVMPLSAFETRTTPIMLGCIMLVSVTAIDTLSSTYLANTANKRVRLKRSMPNRAPSPSVKRPLRDDKIVTLETVVCARAALIVTLAANLRDPDGLYVRCMGREMHTYHIAQKARASLLVSSVVNGGARSTAVLSTELDLRLTRLTKSAVSEFCDVVRSSNG